MSDLLTQGLKQPDEQYNHLTVGAALCATRQAKGLELTEVSARIKYSAVQLGYLEQQQWERLPTGVPLRGLVRNYARYLEADVDAMLRLLDDEVGPTKPFPSVTDLGSRNTLQSADVAPRGEPAHRTWAWVLLILVLLGVVGVYAINRGWVPDEWLIFDWLQALR